MWRLVFVIVLASVGLGVGLSWRPPAPPPDASMKPQWPSSPADAAREMKTRHIEPVDKEKKYKGRPA